MSDSKITALTATASLLSTDVIPVVTNPPGSPVNKKITAGNLAAAVLGLGGTADIPLTGAGKGIVVTTPDGAHTYRIAINNNGEITSEQLT